MLNLLNRDKIDAMRNKDRTKKDILVMMINDATNSAKNDRKEPGRAVTDLDVVEAAKKTIKRAHDMKASLDKAGVTDQSAPDYEIEVARTYLPSQLTAEQINVIINEVIGDQTLSPKLRGPIMKTMNERYNGQFDNAELKSIVDARLAG